MNHALFYLAAPAVFVGVMGCDSSPAPPDIPQTGLPSPESVLRSDSYDCNATIVEPPARGHDQSCFADAACTASLVTGHRMATSFAPENSLSALRAAILLGVDIVETDIRLTSDGEVVLMHDGDIDRTTQGSGDVADLTLAEVQSFSMESGNAPPGDFSCDRVPNLDDVFTISAGRIVVELEVKDTAAGVTAAEYLRDNDLFGDAFLLCGASECAAARAAVPDVPIMSRPKKPEEVAAEAAYDPPPIMVHIDYSEGFLSPEIIDAIHSVGAKVFANAFVVADLQAFAEEDLSGYSAMFEGGLDVIQTEFPHYALMSIGRLDPP